MSHACVYAVTKDKPTIAILQETLLPWHEYESTGYEEYVENIDVTDEVYENWNTMSDEEKKEYNNDIIKYASDYHGYNASYCNDNQLKFYDKTNPNAKWDWWEVGGRFTGLMSDNNGNTDNDCLPKKDVNFSIYEKKLYDELSEKYDKLVSIVNNREFPHFMDLKEQYGLEKAREIYNSNDVIKEVENSDILDFFEKLEDILSYDKETYLKNKAINVPYAIVYDGKWYERGELGWWGISKNEQTLFDWKIEFDKIWNSIPDDYWVTLIDYHI